MKKKKQYRGIKYAMFPNTKQDIQNQKTFGSCRFVWNKIYDDRQEYYEKYKKSIQITPAGYKEEYEWLKEVDSTRKKGSKKKEPKSKNYLKQLEKVNKIHAKIANQRHDYLHKQSTQISNAYDVVIVEDINMKAIGNKGFHNGKATYDNGYGMFRNFLQYKLEERGKYFIKIDKWYASSQICSKCGNKQKLELKDRIYKCPKCGQIIDRDYNAALNIKAEGKRILYS